MFLDSKPVALGKELDYTIFVYRYNHVNYIIANIW